MGLETAQLGALSAAKGTDGLWQHNYAPCGWLHSWLQSWLRCSATVVQLSEQRFFYFPCLNRLRRCLRGWPQGWLRGWRFPVAAYAYAELRKAAAYSIPNAIFSVLGGAHCRVCSRKYSRQ